jgi:uncharacterized protein
MPERALKSVAAKYHLTVEQAKQILDLLDDGYSIPYVMRYHKELAAGLEPEGFYELIEERRRLEKLDSRRRKILKKLEEREILTDELRQTIENAQDMRELIDHYVPYRPRKRSRSRQALAQGVQPLATRILAQEEFISDVAAAAEPYVNPEVGLNAVPDVLEGVFHIVSDWVAEEKTHRDRQRQVFRQEADIVVGRSGRSLPGRLVREFKSYFDFRQKASKLHPYHMLVILRGKRMKALQYRLEAPLEAMERAAAELYFAGGAGQLEQVQAEIGTEPPGADGEALKTLNSIEFLAACIHHSLTSILMDITAREMEKDLCKQAEDLALSIIRRNVKAMLMAKPVKRRLLGIHPGYRTGCNLAVLDEEGNVLTTGTVYPHPPQNEVAAAKEELARIIREHNVEVIIIGDGTGAQETEALIAGLITETEADAQYTIAPEVGLEAHSGSRSARSDMPDIDPGERCAVALSRRIHDPLTELVKVNLRDLCPQPYADDVNGGSLKKLLDRLVEECVCEVGVDANKSHYSMLRYVSGLGPEKAQELVTFRESRGTFTDRQQLRMVPKIDQESYERAAGFVCIAESENPLDRTRIHPRFYPVALAICRQLELDVAELNTEEGRARVREQASQVQLTDLEKEFDVHYLLLKDILSELSDPWPDPRADGQEPVLRKRRLTMDDLEPDTWYAGTVRNIVDFGVFVDLGIGEDGLVHISELSDGYVQSPYDVVCVGDSVRVRVLRVDQEKRRIALSMRSESSRRERPSRGPRRRREPSGPRRPERDLSDVSVPEAKPTSVRAPRSTLGTESRRVQKAQLGGRQDADHEQAAAESAGAEQQPVSADAAAEASEEGGAEKADVTGLLGKLGLGSIERRGKPSD